VFIGSRVEHFVAMQHESLWRSIRSFLIEGTSAQRLKCLSVENFFTLGINSHSSSVRGIRDTDRAPISARVEN
jgi:hypothetical protein